MTVYKTLVGKHSGPSIYSGARTQLNIVSIKSSSVCEVWNTKCPNNTNAYLTRHAI
jgi:hypothetical protein